MLEAGQLRSVAIAHVDPDKLVAADAYARKHPPHPNESRGIWNVLRTGQSEVYNDISEELLAQVARSPEHWEIIRAIGMKAVVIAPIRVRGRVAGTISVVSAESQRRFDQHHVRLIEELGRRAGVALENAELYKAAQEAARKAEAAARSAAQANRIKDEFLATVSHELRTPLSAIVGWAGILRQRQLEPTVAKGIEVIDRNAQAQVKLVEDILDVSRIITGKLRLEPRPIDLVGLARDAIEVIRPSASSKEISVEFDPGPEICVLVGDPERIRQVVWNLLSNAVKFTDPHGSVRIVIEQHASDVVLTVADSGRGIEPDLLPFVFDRFKQGDASTTRRFGGLGLGLALVRHIVELHGGSVAAESEGPGKGAVFTVKLPIRAVAPMPRERQSAASGDPMQGECAQGLRGVRVLVVDDHPDARDLVTEVLSGAGAAVQTSNSAQEAFDALQRFRPDVLVSDIGMAEEDGYSLIRRVRRLAPTDGGAIPSIALSAYTRSEDRTKALAAGFTTHVGKPVNPGDLIAAVANLVALARVKA